MITVVLDDDPTGTQSMSDISVILDWKHDEAWEAIEPGDRAVHLLTNARAYAAAEAAGIVASAASEARHRFPDARLILRGDSTLRGHLWEEYVALRSVVGPGREDVPLLLVPALPAAGRITIGGVHLLEREGERVPLDLTEYARDGDLAYSSAELARWAEERSAGRFAAANAVTVPLEVVRGEGAPAQIADALAAAVGVGRPVVVVPDAETESDLETIAAGLRLAEEEDNVVVTRCAPAFAAVLSETGATATAPPPSGERGVLVLCGSFVPTTTVQLEHLERAHPNVTVSVRPAALAGSGSDEEVARAIDSAQAQIKTGLLACVMTERERDPNLIDAASQLRVARALASIAGNVEAGVVIAKGGITSAVTAREGLDAHVARVLGPLLPGVALWKLADGRNYVVVPGNVGGPKLLADLVTAILPSVAPC